jgi:DNA ligase 1
MKAFTALFTQLDSSTATSAKVEALKRYFAAAKAQDAAWATYFLSGGKPRQVVPTGSLRLLACQRAELPEWLFEESYQAVGDLAETIAHVLPAPTSQSDLSLSVWVEQRLLPLRDADAPEQAARVLAYWDELDAPERFILTKLIGGGFRVGVSKLLVQRALAELSGVDAKVVAQRMMGYTDKTASPSAENYLRLISTSALTPADSGQPYPFFLAHPVEGIAADFDTTLGPVSHWLVEWKYDGIRAQVVKRNSRVWIWSRGEELVTDRFPEVAAAMQALPNGTVLDGEILVWKDDAPAPFALLQQRIGRKTLTKKILTDVPVTFMAYDLLEQAGVDVRDQTQTQRRGALEVLAAEHALRLSPLQVRTSWAELSALREEARARGVEGFMLKHIDSRYGQGRTKRDGTWWKWKTEPLTVDAVLIYAQAGHGRRASVYTDYTFAVWSRAPLDAAEAQAVVDAIEARQPAVPGELQLVAFAKAYSGLTDEEFKGVDKVIRATTLEKFGPVRSVKPSMVFELGFEGINRSPRHKSGIAVRFPRMLRIRSDKPLFEADTLATLEAFFSPQK